MPDIPSKFQKDASITFRVILLTHRQTNRQTKSDKNITSLAEVITSFVNLRFPVDSMRLATLTVSPKRQYLGIVSPTTPATTEPLCTPQRIIILRSGRWAIYARKTSTMIDKKVACKIWEGTFPHTWIDARRSVVWRYTAHVITFVFNYVAKVDLLNDNNRNTPIINQEWTLVYLVFKC